MSICLAVIAPGSVHLRCAESITGAVVSKVVDWVYYHQVGPYLDDGRNECVMAFMERFTDCDRLLMVDSDIEFLPEDVVRLAEDDLPIISGVYHSVYDGVMLPVVYDWGLASNGKRHMGPVKRWPDVALDEEWEEPICIVAGAGAGFLMVKREVFETLGEIHGPPQPWFAEDIRDGCHMGEDLCFNLRAADAGFVTHVDRRVQVAHHKGIRLGGTAAPAAVPA